MGGTLQKLNDWSVSQDSAANTADTVTKAAVAGHSHWITGFEVVVTAAAVGASDVSVELRSGATRVWKGFIGAAAVRGTTLSRDFNRAFKLNVGDAANLVVAAGGAAVVTVNNLRGYTQRG